MSDLLVFCENVDVAASRSPNNPGRLVVTLEDPNEDDILNWVKENVEQDKLNEYLGELE